MADKTVVAGSSVTASQLKELFRQIDDQSLGHAEMQAFIEHRNPFAFERNEHGHIVLTITGLDLTGEQEIARHLASPNAKITDWAKSCLLSKNDDSYDKNNRLVAGKTYRVALMPTNVIKIDHERTTEALRQYGASNFGYDKGFAGLIPRIRETISNRQMEEMGFGYVTGLHDPIKDSDGHPLVLFSHRDVGERWLVAELDRPDDCWVGNGAAALLVSAS